MALQEMGHGHSRKIPHSAGAESLHPNSNRLLLKMGQSRGTQQNNQPPDQKVHMGACDHMVRGSRRNRHRQRPQFTSHNFKEFYKDWGIKLSFATPRHPQSNGQAESTNKTMVNMLKKRLEGSQGNWAEELHGVLWAYRTTPKTATQETPNALVYGAEAIIPTEMHVKTTISGTTSQEENHELMSLSLDLLDEKREAARLRNRAYQQEVAKT